MKTKLVHLLITLGITLSAFGQYSPPTNGLIGWWRGEGNATDTFGGYHGIVQDMAFTNGVSGQAFAAGSDRHLLIPDSPAFKVSSFTIGAWIKVHADSWVVVCRQSSDVGAWSLSCNMDGTIHFAINYGSENIGDILRVPISYHAWHQVTATLDTTLGKMSIYIDGTLAGQKSTTAVPVQDLAIIGDTGISIGNTPNWDFPLIGDIDEVVFYSRALSQAEVQSLCYSCTPRRATAIPQVVNGFVVGATVTDAGCGYTNPPVICVQGGNGSGATATAIVNSGLVAGITITSPGAGYTVTPKILIASPPFMPWLEIGVSAVKVTQHVVLGRKYLLLSSSDLVNWAQVGTPFVAQDELITQQFSAEETGRYFRIQEIP